MKTLLLVFTLSAALLSPTNIYAETLATATHVSAADQAKEMLDADKKPTPAQVSKEAGDVLAAVEEVKEAKETGEGMKLAIMALLAALFKFLLSAVKLSGAFWKGRGGKITLRLVTVTLGVLAFFSSALMGMGWMDALTVGLSGPLAVAFHEYTVLIPSLAKRKDGRDDEGTAEE
jgi:hypothetical protein